MFPASQAARASNSSTGRAWIWAVVASLRGAQRRLRRRRVTFGGFLGFALLEPLLAALSKPVVYRPGVAYLLNGNAGNHHDLLRQHPDSLQRREEVVQTLLMSSRGHHTCTAPTPHRRWAHIQARSQSREPTNLKVQGCFH